MEDLFVRCTANPLISTRDLPYRANTVFNAGAADLGNEVVLLLRVESCSGRSHLTVARSSDGIGGWRVGDRALLHPEQGFAQESFGVEVLNVNEFDDEGEVFGRPDQVELDVIIKNGLLI